MSYQHIAERILTKPFMNCTYCAYIQSKNTNITFIYIFLYYNRFASNWPLQEKPFHAHISNVGQPTKFAAMKQMIGENRISIEYLFLPFNYPMKIISD